MNTKNKIEIEIKLILKDINLKNLKDKIEKTFNLKALTPFHQTTHQFFELDFTQQVAFPRVRNEQDGSMTLTVKVKIKEKADSFYFKRLELESKVSDVESIIKMMPFFGYENKVSWEKRRINFIDAEENNKEKDFEIFIDDTPMGYFLEIESDEDRIEEIIKALNLEKLKRSNKSYLGLWEDCKKDGVKDMLF